MFDPDGMRPFLGNWEEVAVSLVERLRRELVGRIADKKTKQLLAGLMAYPGMRPEWRAPATTPTAPTIPLVSSGPEPASASFPRDHGWNASDRHGARAAR